MKWALELVSVPVADVDRAKAFYVEQLDFDVHTDTQVSDDFRVVQLTPRGSACSIALLDRPGGVGMAPGTLRGLQLVVSDLRTAHAELVQRGLEVSPIQVFDGGAPRPVREGDDLNYAGFAFFEDPDGNAWAIQQISDRT